MNRTTESSLNGKNHIQIDAWGWVIHTDLEYATETTAQNHKGRSTGM